jgi:hypothetical protein
MTVREFSPGGRFSSADAVALVILLCVAGDMGAMSPWFGAAIGFVVVHFFLFCNVVRMDRSAELVWAAVFVAFSIATVLLGWPRWPVTFAISLAVTVVLVTRELRKPSYHGVLWRRINPGLPNWWEAHCQQGDS